MQLSTLLHSGKVTLSCELFPPKQGGKLLDATELVREMAQLRPSFMSVTYGAGGTTSGKTVEIADDIQNRRGIPALLHLTCAAAGRDQIRRVLADAKEKGIENVLALRGDLPPGMSHPPIGGYAHASDLMAEIRQTGGFCIGGACYPEGHPESPSLTSDIAFLKRKVESGCEFLTTQMFFDNNILYSFMFRLLKAGVDVPVVAGIMPVTNAKQIVRICELSHTALPPRFRAIVDTFAGNPAAMKQAGIAYATEQVIDLIANGVKNIHLYTMNHPDVAGQILKNLSEIIDR